MYPEAMLKRETNEESQQTFIILVSVRNEYQKQGQGPIPQDKWHKSNILSQRQES